MSEYRTLLQRVGDRVEMHEPALDLLSTRRGRRVRNRRIGSAALALLLAIAAIGGAVSIFRSGAHREPASTDQTTTITPENVGDLGPAWTAKMFAHNGFASDPIVRGGTVYVSTDQVYAFSADCRIDGGTCEPVAFIDESRYPTPIEAIGDLLIAGNTAFDLTCPTPLCHGDPLPSVSSYARLVALEGDRRIVFAAGELLVAGFCDPVAQGGWTCGRLWRADEDPDGGLSGSGYSKPFVENGLVYVSGEDHQVPTGGRVSAFPIDCHPQGKLCQPLWRGPAGVASRFMTVADGMVLVPVFTGGDSPVSRTLVAFDANCGTSGATCDPAWTARVDGEGPPPTIADGIVYAAGGTEAGGTLNTFPLHCHSDGTTCDPIWTAPLDGGRLSGLVVDGGLVYALAGRTLDAFPTSCAETGPRCSPSWSARIDLASVRPISPVVANGVAYVTGPSEIRAYGPDGMLWSNRIDGIMTTSPVVAGDSVYVGTRDGTLYAFALGAGPTNRDGLLISVGAIVALLLIGVAIAVGRRRTRRLVAVR